LGNDRIGEGALNGVPLDQGTIGGTPAGNITLIDTILNADADTETINQQILLNPIKPSRANLHGHWTFNSFSEVDGIRYVPDKSGKHHHAIVVDFNAGQSNFIADNPDMMQQPLIQEHGYSEKGKDFFILRLIIILHLQRPQLIQKIPEEGPEQLNSRLLLEDTDLPLSIQVKPTPEVVVDLGLWMKFVSITHFYLHAISVGSSSIRVELTLLPLNINWESRRDIAHSTPRQIHQ
jgi:hypothetical protein